MMTLDEAIKHAEEVAEEQEKLCKVNDSFNFSQPKWEECANEHRQLAEWLKDYKRLKEQEPCEDAVSREDVIKAIDHHTFDTDDGLCLDEDISIILEELPPVTPAQRWIPVSERLPEKTDWYLVTFKVYGGNYAVSHFFYIKTENLWVRDNISKKVFDNVEIIAWMPLPEPYQAEKGEE